MSIAVANTTMLETPAHGEGKPDTMVAARVEIGEDGKVTYTGKLPDVTPQAQQAYAADAAELLTRLDAIDSAQYSEKARIDAAV